MKYVPHKYQQHTTKFIEEHNQAAILLGMGLGKTVSTLTAINNLMFDYFCIRNVLVIAPPRVARDTWPQEVKKWDHLKHLTITPVTGTPTQRQQELARDSHIWTISNHQLTWLTNQYKNKPWPFDMVIIDELSGFKNHTSQRFKALKKVRPHIDRIVGLTGTPAPNNLLDLWAQYYLLDGGQRLEKTITNYRNRYFRPGKRNGHIIYEWIPLPDTEEKIYDAISDITISMRTTDYLDLPTRTDHTITVTMTQEEKKVYDQLKKHMVVELDGTTVDAANAATLSGKLLQLASGAIYTDTGAGHTIVHAKKLDALDTIIEEAEDQPVLIAYWFKHERERIMTRHPTARPLSSSQDFEDWNAGKVPIGLIHPASAGHGLNLQAGGHILVWTTTPWSLELYEQTNARLHRQGQTSPVTIYHINTTGTIDERVQQALKTKDVGQQSLIAAVAAELNQAKVAA